MAAGTFFDSTFQSRLQRHLEVIESPGESARMFLGTKEQVCSVGKLVILDKVVADNLRIRRDYPVPFREGKCIVLCAKEFGEERVHAIYSLKEIEKIQTTPGGASPMKWGILEISEQGRKAIFKTQTVGEEALTTHPKGEVVGWVAGWVRWIAGTSEKQD